MTSALDSQQTEKPQNSANLISMINEATAPMTGGDYFRSLVARLAGTLNVRKALITECLDYPDNHVRTLAFWEGDKFSEDITFDLDGTPCQHVINDEEFCFHPEQVRKRFPEWSSEEGGIESFIGIPVFAPSDGRLIGHIAVYDPRPMHPSLVVESMFRIIAARAGAEIERLQAEQALRDSESRARQHLSQLAHVSRLNAMSELTSSLTHEINQPLTAILNYCRSSLKLLDSEKITQPELRKGIQAAVESAERASRVVGKLRQYVRRGEIHHRLIPAGRLIDECRILLDTEARHHHVDLNIDFDSSLPTVRVDAILIQQVILNLVRNGIDAINDSDSSLRELKIRVTSGTPKELLIEVRDSGSGVAEEIRQKLFEPFSSTRKDGMGIGLALCTSIIESHGGRLWLASTGPDGSAFRLTLPVPDRTSSA